MALEDELERRMRAYCAADKGSENERLQAIALADLIGRNERTILAALTERKAPEGTEQHLCGHCGAQYLLMGADYLDTLSKALDDAGAPKWSADRSVMFSLTGRIEALAAERKAPVEVEGLVERLRELHNDARGCAFDLVPADGPIARLALFMHENGDRLSDALQSQATELATLKQQLAEREEALREACDILGDSRNCFRVGEQTKWVDDRIGAFLLTQARALTDKGPEQKDGDQQ